MRKQEILDFVRSDMRMCRSKYLIKFFSKDQNKHRTEVIIFEKELWFVSLGWCVTFDVHTGFAGCEVRMAASYGAKAKSGYPSKQKGNDYEIVTDWFLNLYKEKGVVGFPNIWRIKEPKKQTSKEAHYI